MVVFLYAQRVNTRTPTFGRALGRTTITAHDSTCRVLPDGRQAETWTTDRSLRDPLLHHQAAAFHPSLMLVGGGRTKGSRPRMSERRPRLERMFVPRAAGQTPRGVGHMVFTDGVTRSHYNQIMRADNLSPRSMACLCGHQRNILGISMKKTVAEPCLRRPTDRATSLPVGAPRPRQGTTTDRLRSASGNPLPLRTGTAHYSHVMVDTVAVARQLIRIVAADPGLPLYVRREAGSLESMVSAKPDLVLDNLEALRKRVIPDLALLPPAGDYARCISVDVFWDHHIKPERRELFASDARVYRRYLESVTDPAHAISSDLRDSRVIVPAAHSWLVPFDQIAVLDGTMTKSHLQIDEEPPYIVMAFPVSKMQACGVEIRPPRGVDAIPSRLVRWSRQGVPNERIDQDIPTAALGHLEWRP